MYPALSPLVENWILGKRAASNGLRFMGYMRF